MIDQELRVERSAVDLYFLELDGSSFKATFVYKPYFFVAISKDSLMQEVEAYLMRRFDGQIDSTAIVSKEDLELVCADISACTRARLRACSISRALFTDHLCGYCFRFSSFQNNHLSGLQRSYIKIMFKNVQDLMSVRKVIQV